MNSNFICLLTFSSLFLAACNSSYSSNPVADYTAYGAATGPADTNTPPNPLMKEDVDCNNMFRVATSTDQSPLTFKENTASSFKIYVTSNYDSDFAISAVNLPCADCFKLESRKEKSAIYVLNWNPGKLPTQQTVQQSFTLTYQSERTKLRCRGGQGKPVQLYLQVEVASGASATPFPTSSPAAAPAAPAKPATAPQAETDPSFSFVLSSFPQKTLILGKDNSFEFQMQISHESFSKETQPKIIWSAPIVKNTRGKQAPADATSAITCVPPDKDANKTRYIGHGQWQVNCEVKLANLKIPELKGSAAKTSKTRIIEFGFTGEVSSISGKKTSNKASSPLFSVQVPQEKKEKAP